MSLTLFHRAFVIAACGVAFGAAPSGAQAPRATTQPPPTRLPRHHPPIAPGPRRRALPDDYKLQAGDKLRIEVYKDTQLSQSVQIRPDGKILAPARR